MNGLARKYGYRLGSIWTMLTGFDRPFQTLAIFAGRGGKGTRTIAVRGDDYRFEVRGAMDTWSVKESLLDRLYERYGFVVEPGWTVIDIGAGIGEYAISVAAATGGRVLAFEPFPPSFALLERNVALNGAANVEMFEVAVTGQPRSLGLDVSSAEPVMVEAVDLAPGSSSDQAPIASATLAEILQDEGLDVVDVLKLDCEGGEYDILLNSPPAVIARVQRIVMEYHEGAGGHTHADLVTSLNGAGFAVQVFPNPVHPDQLGYLRASR